MRNEEHHSRRLGTRARLLYEELHAAAHAVVVRTYCKKPAN
jgi:hypothetical protein